MGYTGSSPGGAPHPPPPPQQPFPGSNPIQDGYKVLTQVDPSNPYMFSADLLIAYLKNPNVKEHNL